MSDSKSDIKITLCVINDLTTDNRLHRISLSLYNHGYDVNLIGRRLPDSVPINRPYRTTRLKLLINKGFAFYSLYNFRLTIYLLFHRTDILVANDLDTLPANFIVSLIKRKPLVYDSHELFTEVPELINRKFVQSVWLKIEKLLLTRIKHAYTVCESIADYYNSKYGIKMQVVRNLPHENKNVYVKPVEIPALKNKKIILYQGSVNLGRGIEFVIQAMQYLDNAVFLIVGNGDLYEEFMSLSQQLNLQSKVHFTGRVKLEDLPAYTAVADVGISIEENMGLNYYYALPNKLFDYIQYGVPVLGSPLIEISKIISDYNIGMLIEKHEPQHIAEKLNFMLSNENQRMVWKRNLKTAAQVLNWENEEQQLLKVYANILV